MRVTRAEEQAVRLAMRLARDGDQRTLQELASEEGIPEPTVAKVLAQLRDSGLVRAIRGRKGGYELTRPPVAITVADLVQAVGPDRFDGRFCQSVKHGSVGCERGDLCNLRHVWQYLEAQLFRVLDQTTLADLLETDETVRKHLETVWRGDGPDAALPKTGNAAPVRLVEVVAR